MHDLNGGLFLNVTSFSPLSFPFPAVTKRSAVTAIYNKVISQQYTYCS